MKRRKRTPGYSYRLVAVILAATCLVILGLLIFVPVPENNIPPGQGAGEGPGSTGSLQQGGGTAGGEADSSASYTPLASLESLIQSTRRRLEFTVLSPAETVPKGTLVFFNWADEEKGPWKVMVLDNKGVTMKEEEVTAPEFTLSSPTPGLYYWTVAREDKILHIGRLAVR